MPSNLASSSALVRSIRSYAFKRIPPYSSDPLATGSADKSADAAPSKLTGATSLNKILVIYAAVEFLAVVCSAYFSGEIYHHFVLQLSHTNAAYILAAIAIAILVLIISLGLHNFVRIRRQSRHNFLWKGISADWLAFSFFVTILFFTRFADYYSRATFIFQITAVSISVFSIRALFFSWFQSAIASNRIEARRVILIGAVSDCSTLADRFKTSGIRVISSICLPKRHNMKDAANTNPKMREIIRA
jgi:FlaA1/EpsC-like NDP-sugar epimerase